MLLAILLSGKRWYPLYPLAAAILLGGCIWHQKWLYKEYRNELETISNTLDLMLQQKTVAGAPENTDTLLAKILAQLQRFQESNHGYQETLRGDRDSIKKFLAEISHQLRTPLANMETYLALLDSSQLTDEERQTYLRAVTESEEKIKFLIERFILSARMENRVIQIHKIPADLRETIANAVFQIYKKAEQKHITVEIEDTTKAGTLIAHDSNWVCEALYNLLDNSVKYSPDGSTIRISLQNNEMFTEISVEDEGIGICPEEENQIFQLYYRGKNLTGQEGYGIGLFVSGEIIKKHGGFLKVRRKKRGLAMSICLPATGAL